MDLRRHSQCYRRLLIAVIVSLFSNVYAMKNRETPMPSPAPSISAAPSYLPSVTPSFRPSLAPSSTPSTSPPSTSPSTSPPSISPSQDPTGQPTPSPSSAPTSEPTPSPSSAPSTSEPPSTSPTKKDDTLVSVPMPKIGINFFLDDNDASSSSFLNLDTDVTDFLQYVLTSRSDESFDYIILDYDVSQYVAERRRLKTGVSVAIEGMAFYAVGTESPATGDIAQLLKGYFSFWGIQDLEDHLHATGLPSAQDVQVYIDGSIVVVVTDELPGGEDTNQVRGSVLTQSVNDDPPLESGGIVGIIVGSVVLITAISLALVHGQKKRRRLNRLERRHRPSVVSESAAAAGTGRIGARPLPDRGGDTPDRGDAASSSDGVSIDNSLYTTDASILSSPNRVIVPNSYDAKRLDKVIAAAKQHSDRKSSFV